jgi:hypothetical protein
LNRQSSCDYTEKYKDDISYLFDRLRLLKSASADGYCDHLFVRVLPHLLKNVAAHQAIEHFENFFVKKQADETIL